ncbi:hypothetical protein ES703_59867 [subsurface metagenome]
MRRDHKDVVTRMNDQVMDECGRQILSQHIPCFPAVCCDVDSDIGAHKKNVSVPGVLPDHIDGTQRNIAGDIHPILSVVG